MNDFLIHVSRLQDAGVSSLTITLGSDEDNNRTMQVRPHSRTQGELAERFPPRTFLLDGTDRLLESLKESLTNSDEDATDEKVQALIQEHRLLADDLQEWWLMYKGVSSLTEEDLDSVELSESDLAWGTERTLGILRGLDIAKEQEALRNTPAAKARKDTSEMNNPDAELVLRARRAGFERLDSNSAWYGFNDELAALILSAKTEECGECVKVCQTSVSEAQAVVDATWPTETIASQVSRQRVLEELSACVSALQKRFEAFTPRSE